MKVDDLLELEGAEELAVLLHPVGGLEAPACGLLDLAADEVGAVEVVDFEADDGDEVGLGEEALGVGEASEGIAGVVLVEAGGEDAGDTEALVARDEAKRGEFALRAGDEDGVIHRGADGLCEVFADDDGGMACVAGSPGVDGAGSSSVAEPVLMACKRSETRRSSAGRMPLMRPPPLRAPREMRTWP